MSTTTVEVKKNTAKVLEELKAKYRAKSIDETIKRLISKAEDIPDSMFASHPKMTRFKSRDEAKFHKL
jgi:hypothetical protein